MRRKLKYASPAWYNIAGDCTLERVQQSSQLYAAVILSLIFLTIMLARLSHESYILLEFRRYHLGALIFIPVF
jgi:hypothetical protein